jgi:hypothetical protein
MTKYSDCFRICINKNVPVGFVGSIDNDIRVCVDDKYKKRGIAKFMILEASIKLLIKLVEELMELFLKSYR